MSFRMHLGRSRKLTVADSTDFDESKDSMMLELSVFYKYNNLMSAMLRICLCITRRFRFLLAKYLLRMQRLQVVFNKRK